MIWGWFGNYYWLCYKCLGREREDTPRTQLTPPNGTACVPPREITAHSGNSSSLSRIWIYGCICILYFLINIYYKRHTYTCTQTHTYIWGHIHTHTHICKGESQITSHNSTEGRGQTHFFLQFWQPQSADWTFLGISKGYFLKDPSSH